MEGTCYGPPHVGCNENIGINSLSDELLGSKTSLLKVEGLVARILAKVPL